MFKLLAVFTVLLLGASCSEELSKWVGDFGDGSEFFQPKFLEFLTDVIPPTFTVVSVSFDILATEAEKASNLDELFSNVGQVAEEILKS